MPDPSNAVTPFTAARLVVVLLFLLPAVSTAQTRVFVITAGTYFIDCCQQPLLWDIDVDARRIIEQVPIVNVYRSDESFYAWSYGPAPTVDGRYVLWTGHLDGVYQGQAMLTALERRTNTLLARNVPHQFPTVATSPTQVAGFYVEGDTFNPDVVTLTPTDEQRFSTRQCRAAQLVDLSSDGDRLFMACGGFFDVVHSATGENIVRVPVPGVARPGSAVPRIADVVPDRDGKEVFARASINDNQVEVIRRHDAGTGALLAERTLQSFLILLGADPRTGDLYAVDTDALVVLDGTTLAEKARIPRPVGGGPVKIAFDPHVPRAYLVLGQALSQSSSPFTVHRTTFASVDTESMSVTLAVDLGVRSWPVGIAVVPMPGRTRDLSARVTGSQVTLDWMQDAGSGRTTGYAIEVGLSPGATNFTFLVPAVAPTFTAPHVPSGTYYVRVRAANAVELGRFSNEVQVVVP